jgi:hypothetical protein
MKVLFISAVALVLAFSFGACGGGSAPTFCDTTCNNDTIRFTANNVDKSFVAISMKDCQPDSITWGHGQLSTNRKMMFADLVGKETRINKNFVRAHINDTSNVWVIFNDCITGQGFITKVPFNKTDNIFRKNSAFNSTDPKFHVDESLVAYTDKGNVFVEDMATGKKATVTFGKMVETFDYTDMHATVDSVNITPTKVWVKIKIDNEWTVVEKEIELK